MQKFSKIALGTVQFGLPYGIANQSGQTPFEEVEQILNFAYLKGIQTLDTAYGYGQSESVLGKTHQNRFQIITKFLPERMKGNIQEQFETSLKRLKLNSVYGYLAHRPLSVLENKNIWSYLMHLKQNDKVKKIGFSFNAPGEYFALKKKGFIPDLVQLPFNYFDNRFMEVMEDLKENNCEIHARSVFLQGLFFMNIKDLSNHFSEVKPIISELQNNFGINLAGVLLNHVLNKCDLIDKVVIGVQNIKQFKHNIDSLNKSQQQLKEFSGQVDDSILQPSKWVY